MMDITGTLIIVIVVSIMALLVSISLLFVVRSMDMAKREKSATIGGTRFVGMTLPPYDELVRLHDEAIERAFTEEGKRPDMRGWTVIVRSVPEWSHCGMTVAGLTFHDMRTVEVGCDLAALAHEYRETVHPNFHSGN